MPDMFLWLDSGAFLAEIPQKWYVIFTKSYQEALFSIYSIIGVDNFGPLVYVMSAKFLHYKGIIFAFVINKHLRGGGRDTLRLCM